MQAISIGTRREFYLEENASKIEYGEVNNIVSGIEVNIIRKEVKGRYRLTGIICSGNADGIFRLYADDKKIFELRTSPANRFIFHSFKSPLEFEDKVVLRLNVEHNEIISRSFQGAFIGYE